MIAGARYVHTNLIARDWRALSRFYQDVFGCTPVPPERRLSGSELEAGTGVAGAAFEGVHLRLPGHGADGPTLEIFQYAVAAQDMPRAVNRAGFAHIAFAVGSVRDARNEIIRCGGSSIGEIVTMAIAGAGDVTWCYVADPEGNILELQAWTR